MIDVKVIFTQNNRKFEIIRAYDGVSLYKSGRYKNFTNAQLGAEIKIKENNWRLVGPDNVAIIHK